MRVRELRIKIKNELTECQMNLMNWILKVYLLCLTGHQYMLVLNRTLLSFNRI